MDTEMASGTEPVKKIILKQSGVFKAQGQSSPWGWENQSLEFRQPSFVSDDFQLDENERFKGSVVNYQKFKGFGFILLDRKGFVPGDKVFVHWKDIQTSDRFPQLVQGMEVEFGMVKVQDKRTGSGCTLRAKNVSLVAGSMISLQDELDAGKKNFVGGQHVRYTGALKFYDPARGGGWVVVDDGLVTDSNVPKEIKVEMSEVNAGGETPVKMDNILVEFGIWQTPKGQYKVYNMTLPGGVPITSAVMDRREVYDSILLTGKVENYSAWKGWGFIKPDHPELLPAMILTKLMEMANTAHERGRKYSEEKLLYFRKEDILEGITLSEGQPVTFSAYTDSKGAGASAVRRLV